jgi:hypothetical protein
LHLPALPPGEQLGPLLLELGRRTGEGVAGALLVAGDLAGDCLGACCLARGFLLALGLVLCRKTRSARKLVDRSAAAPLGVGERFPIRVDVRLVACQALKRRV